MNDQRALIYPNKNDACTVGVGSKDKTMYIDSELSCMQPDFAIPLNR